MPCVEILIGLRNVKMTKNLEFEFLLYLFERGFDQWDNIVVSYLNQRQVYRKALNKAFSKTKYLVDYKKEIVLDNKPVSIEKSLSQYDKFYSFIYTDSNYANKLITLQSYQVLYRNIDNNTTLSYNFTLKQMMIIYKLTKVIRLDKLLVSLLYHNNIEPFMMLNLECFDNIQEDFFNFFKANSSMMDISKIEMHRFNQFYELNVKYLFSLNLRVPTFLKREMVGSKLFLNEVNIPEIILSEISKKEINQWKVCFYSLQKQFKTLFPQNTGMMPKS